MGKSGYDSDIKQSKKQPTKKRSEMYIVIIVSDASTNNNTMQPVNVGEPIFASPPPPLLQHVSHELGEAGSQERCCDRVNLEHGNNSANYKFILIVAN
ncbi:6657_t:CDS:2 [Paraglomus brasilianum]|uniref:6657_t:CDS:1 n=1 Tax=Paraglomus brasilianum TaxID=144538 RepID=A0A9N9B653_9GLOM|nr:6657_t:CDS:2 [Paraglomus brasilianum]